MIKDATTTSVSIKTKTTEKITPSASGPISTTTSLLLSPRFSNGIIPQHSAFVPIFDNEILIYGLSHIKVRPGDWVGVVGYGFDSNTVFHIGPTISVPISATSSTDFSFQVPNIPYDTYEVWVTNATSSSQKRSPVQLVVGSITDIRPSILSVTPEIASQGDTIKVTAEKLDNYGNTIYSSLGIIKNVPSPDGHSLTFKVFDLPRTTAFLQSKTMDQMIVSFGMGTMGTRSLNYGYFYISK